MTIRQAARLLVVDPELNVLLFEYEDGERRWWATPGGGLEGGETFEEAAVREAAEELALEPATLEPLWQQVVTFRFRGTKIHLRTICNEELLCCGKSTGGRGAGSGIMLAALR